MPISTNSEASSFLCRGGLSFGRRYVVKYEPPKETRELGSHEPIEPRYCRRCKVYLGCKFCAQRPSELICVRCHDWATDEAEEEHGPMVSRDLAASKVRQLTAGIGRA